MPSETKTNNDNLPVCPDACAKSKWDSIDTSRGPRECWPYEGTLTEYGHARVWTNDKTDIKITHLHRAIWAAFHGFTLDELPSSVQIHHECDNPACCNPYHLTPMYTGDHARHHRSNLLDDVDPDDIRRAWENTDATKQEIADQFETTLATVNHIVYNQRHIDISDNRPEGPWFDVWRGER